MKPGDVVLLRFPLGDISAERLRRIKKRLVDWIAK